MGVVVNQYDVFLVALDPTLGHEIRKSRPCLIVSPDEMNDHIATVIIVPMTTKSHAYPTRVAVEFGGKSGWIVLDQIRAIDKKRLVKRLGRVKEEIIDEVKSLFKQILVD